MANTRASIAAALAPLFVTLTKANGYALDLGKNVIVWPAVPVAEDQLPAVCYADTSAFVEAMPMKQSQHTLELTVWAFVTTIAQARSAMQDVVALLWSNLTLGGTVEWVALKSHAIEQQQNVIAATMTFEVLYRTPMGEV